MALPSGSSIAGPNSSGASSILSNTSAFLDLLMGSKSSASGTDSAVTSGGTTTRQTMLDKTAMDNMLRTAFESTAGLSAISSGSKLAGTYGDTTQMLLANDLLARITGQVAEKGAAAVTTETPKAVVTSKSSQTATPPKLTGDAIMQSLLLGLGTAVGTRALKKSGLLEAIGLGDDPATAGLRGGAETAGASGGASFVNDTKGVFNSPSVDITPELSARGMSAISGTTSSDLGNAALAGFSDGGGTIIEGTSTPILDEVAASVMEGGFGSGLTSFLADGTELVGGALSEGAVGGILADGGIDAAGSLAAGGFTPGIGTANAVFTAMTGESPVGDALVPAVGGFVSSAGQIISSIFGGDGGSGVICTELHSKGLLDSALYKNARWYSGRISTQTRDGYHLWAKPYVKLMRKSALATAITVPFAVGRYIYLGGKWNLCGWLTVTIGEPACWLIGLFAKSGSSQELPIDGKASMIAEGN